MQHDTNNYSKKISFKERRALIRDQLYRKRYLVPNAVTVGSMFCGFLSVVYSASGRFEKASLAIFFAILLDGLDGRVARKLNATSRFGGEFDSFSDFLSFGIAPAILIYHWCFQRIADEFGVLVTFIYALCAASRLVRFNLADENLANFTGLPSPGAAGAVASTVLLAPVAHDHKTLVIFMAFEMILLGYLMVSKFEYFSIKQIKLRKLRFAAPILVGLIIALVWYGYRYGLIAITCIYALSGPIKNIVSKKKKSAPAR